MPKPPAGMTADQVWSLVHAERHALIDDLERLTPEQWQTPSLCQGWAVRDVAAHLIGNATATTRGLLAGMVAARFNFEAMTARGVARHRDDTPDQLVAQLRSVADRTDSPPVALASRFVEEVAHGEDIRRPLGFTRDYPREIVDAAIDYQLATSEKVGGAKELGRRVRLVSTDSPLARGSGPEVRGPSLELLMVVSGREPRPGSLSGEGLEQARRPGPS